MIGHEKEILHLSSDLSTTRDHFRVAEEELKTKKEELEQQKRLLFELVLNEVLDIGRLTIIKVRF